MLSFLLVSVNLFGIIVEIIRWQPSTPRVSELECYARFEGFSKRVSVVMDFWIHFSLMVNFLASSERRRSKSQAFVDRRTADGVACEALRFLAYAYHRWSRWSRVPTWYRPNRFPPSLCLVFHSVSTHAKILLAFRFRPFSVLKVTP